MERLLPPPPPPPPPTHPPLNPTPRPTHHPTPTPLPHPHPPCSEKCGFWGHYHQLFHYMSCWDRERVPNLMKSFPSRRFGSILHGNFDWIYSIDGVAQDRELQCVICERAAILSWLQWVNQQYIRRCTIEREKNWCIDSTPTFEVPPRSLITVNFEWASV